MKNPVLCFLSFHSVSVGHNVPRSICGRYWGPTVPDVKCERCICPLGTHWKSTDERPLRFLKITSSLSHSLARLAIVSFPVQPYWPLTFVVPCERSLARPTRGHCTRPYRGSLSHLQVEQKSPERATRDNNKSCSKQPDSPYGITFILDLISNSPHY